MLAKHLNTGFVKWLKVFLGIALVVAIVMVIYFPNYAKLNRLRQTNKDLLVRIDQLEDEIDDLQGKMERVGDDPHIYEEIARDTLGVARENEIVIDIEE
jgi:cell division protein FtsB